jgi:hypothetical protein
VENFAGLLLLHLVGFLYYFTNNSTLALPCCIVIDFCLNNQPDALIIPILFCYKSLHVSGIFSAHHQEFSTAHSALVRFMQISDDRFQAESGSILTAFTPRKCSWYSFSLGSESTPGPWYGRKEYVTENPVTPTGIDHGTVRLVAQLLNHYATPGPATTRGK